jgi:dolichol-phosphate hexosyltransferase
MIDAKRWASIIIPTLNEQSGIKKTIKSIPISLIENKLGYEVEILVVDGGSMDSTREIASKMGAQVIVEKRKGYGRACKSGFAAARGEILVTIDADNTYPAEYIANYIEELDEKNLDFITVNRFSGMEKGAMSFTRRVGNKILTLAMRALYSVDIKDSQSGMWIMRKKFISDVRLNSDDMSMSEEIKIIAFRFFNAKELDGKYYARTGTAKLKVIQDGLKNLKYLFDYKKKVRSAVISSSVGGEEKEIQLRG